MLADRSDWIDAGRAPRAALPGGFAGRSLRRRSRRREGFGVLFFWLLLMAVAGLVADAGAAKALAALGLPETPDTRIAWITAALALAAWPLHQVAAMAFVLVMGLARVALVGILLAVMALAAAHLAGLDTGIPALWSGNADEAG